jgi:Putative binding domain, N-terminal/Viral BACON domain
MRPPTIVILAAVHAARAATAVVETSVTNTQAVIHVVTDRGGNCTYRISESNTLSPPVYDVNTALFASANSDARAGAVVAGNDHFFVVGTRTAARGVDGMFYSRALAANTAHYGGVTCGPDAEVTFTFTTRNILTGNTFTEPLPFDAAALGHYALPTPDYGKPIVDPLTGLKIQFLTGPGKTPESTNVIPPSDSSGNIPGEVLASVNWSNPNNCLSIDGSFCAYTAASGHDTLLVRLHSTCGQNGSCAGDGWGNAQNGGPTGISVDTYQMSITGNGGGSSIQVDVAMTWNGVDQGTEWAVVTLPASTATVIYPSSFTASHSPWQGAGYPAIPAVYWHVVQRTYAVNTSGTRVTIPNSCENGGGCFPLDTRVLRNGSKISVSGVEYTIASVDSATQVTLTTSAGTQVGVPAYLSNFGVLVRRHSTSGGTLNLDGVALKVFWSDTYGNGGTGDQTYESPVTSTDSRGKTGRFMLLPEKSGNYALFWLTNDLEMRLLGRGYLPGHSFGNVDDYVATQYGSSNIFDGSDPNRWYASTALSSNPARSTLIQIDYHPQGVAGCSMPADYQDISAIGGNNPEPTYDPGGADNCNITYTEITKPTEGKGIWSQLNPTITSGKFDCGGGPCPHLSFIQNGYAIMTAFVGQDHEAWQVHVNLASGLVTGQWSTYMNAKGGCRACVQHAPLPANTGSSYYYNVLNDYPGGNTNGAGPYNFVSTTALTTTPADPTCAAVTDPVVTWLKPYTAGCDNITITAADTIPCDPDPSAWEVANMPACSWHSGWTQWQAGAIQPGDWFYDSATGRNDLMVVGKVNGTILTVMRAANPPQGSLMVQNAAYFTTNHAANWTATLYCSFHNNIFSSVAEVDGSTLVWDRRFTGFSHAVLRTRGIASADAFGDIGFLTGISVKLGSYPGLANQAERYRILNNAPFAGKTGVGLTQGYGQSHPGWVSSSSNSILDMSPLAPSTGGVFNLWSQSGVTNPAGTLYRIPAASAFVPMDKRRRAQSVWSGMNLIRDVSGLGAIPSDASGYFQYCSIDHAAATCGQNPEAPGDVFINVPSASVDGRSGGNYDFHRLNSAPLGPESLAVVQYFFDDSLLSHGGMNTNNGRHERRLTTAFGRYNGQDTYSNAKILEGSNIVVFNCQDPQLQRVNDLCGAIMPPDPPTQPGNDFLSVPVNVAAGYTYAEVQFGYAENGASTNFYCTTRQEACNTSAPAGTPFNWETETRTLRPCSSGCTIQVPVLPDHVVYYRTRTSNDGQTWNNGPLAMSIPAISASPDCSDLVFSPVSHYSPASGDIGSVNVTVTDQSCPWSANSSAGWLNITSGGSGTGNGTIVWSVSANSAAPRSADIVSGSASFAVTQSGCTMSINPVSVNYAAPGGPATISVTASAPSCTWTTTLPAGWVSINPTSGSGNGLVTVTATANTGGARSASLTIAGQSLGITQDAAAGSAITGTAVGGGVSLRSASIH